MFSPRNVESNANMMMEDGNAEPELHEAEPLIVGLALPESQHDADWLLKHCKQDGFLYCVTELPTSHHGARRDVMLLGCDDWHLSVIGLLLLQEEEDQQNRSNDSNWEMPLEWAVHMGLPVVMLPSWEAFCQHLSSSSQQKSPNGIARQHEDMEIGEINDGGMDQVGSNGNAPMNGNSTTRQTIATLDKHQALIDYARNVGEASRQMGANGHLWIPMALPETTEQAKDALEQWIQLNQYLNHPKNIGILLDMKPTPPAPPASATNNQKKMEWTQQWNKTQVIFLHHLIGLGAIRGLRFSCSDFLTNKSGYPTLSKGIQFLSSWLLQRLGSRLRILVDGPPAHFKDGPKNNIDVTGYTHCKPYVQYLQHMRKNKKEIRRALDTEEARLEANHCDTLQRPLQPLRDHLENNTYDVFEKDPVKYREYQKAISWALTDFADEQQRSGTTTSSPMVVMVVGAGRGPLVVAVMNAYAELPVQRRPKQLSVWAVEKNPSAVIYINSLLYQQQEDWATLPASVRVVHKDLRHLDVAKDLNNQKADLIVSELLGSFGDNELSPECLDALFTETNVCHSKTVSIPTEYTAYLAPACSVKLHQQVQEQALYPDESEGGHGLNSEGNRVLGMQNAVETPYVVRPQVASQMGLSEKCWTFTHPHRPSKDATITTSNDMNQSAIVEFEGKSVRDAAVYGCGYGLTDADGRLQKAMAIDTNVLGKSSVATASVINGNTPTQVSPPDCPEFNMPWLLTGFLGTFSADLYIRKPASSLAEPEKVSISIEPDTFSYGMFSWFPLYFPLEKPLVVPGSDSTFVRAQICRRTQENRVWYEWSAVVHDKKTGNILQASPIHNPRGRSYCVSSS